MSRRRRSGRHRRRGAAAALALLLCGLSLAAAGAGAAPHIPDSFRHFELPASAYLSAGAQASGGYRLQLTASHVEVPPQQGEPARTSSSVYLELSKPGSSAGYLSRDSRFGAGGTVEADLGELGRVVASFVPLHRHREPIRWCDGDYTVETGLLVGTLVFHGERGYTHAHAASIAATLTREPPVRCHIPASVKPQRDHESRRIGGSSGRHGRQLGVDAFEHPALGTVTVSASSSEHRGTVWVIRQVSAVAPLTALAIDPEAETATLDAPAPFTGSATFTAFPGKEAGTWRGDLSVDFPGEPGVRLAGKRFQGAKLKPGECAPDESNSFCSTSRLLPPIGLKPSQPVARGGR